VRTPVEIRRLVESDLRSYRELRLAALSADPLAFGSTFDRESGYDEPKWADRVTRGASSTGESIWVAEERVGRLVGMIGAFTKEGAFQVFGMWVDPEYRGGGIGGRLLDRLLAWTSTMDRSAEVLLSVNPSQVAAVRLYLAHGFLPTGVVEPLGHTPGAVLHEMTWKSDRAAKDPVK
jgi:ribosomal protein S18 acetylase RimI-like enzyme